MAAESSRENNPGNERSYDYDEALDLSGHGSYNRLVLLACCIIVIAFAMDMFGYSLIVAASRCDLKLGLKETGLLASAPFAGVVLAFPWGFYADRCGRKRALVITTSIGCFFGVLSSIASSWQFMFVVKMIGCSFSTASMTLGMTYLGESVCSKHRSSYLFIMNTLNLTSEVFSFSLAYVILSLGFNVAIPWLGITYRPWRLHTLLCALPQGVSTIMMMLMYESPKFIANKGDVVQALDVLKKIYKWNGGNVDDYPVKSITLKGDTDDTEMQMESFCRSIKKQTLPIFKPPLLWRTIQLFYLLVVCCAANNVYVMWHPTIVNFFFNSFTHDLPVHNMTFCEKVFANVTVDAGEIETVCNDKISPYTIFSGILIGLFYCVVGLTASRLASYKRSMLITTYLVAGISGAMIELKDPIANIIFFALAQTSCIGIGTVASYFVELYPTSYRGLVTSLGIILARLCSFGGVTVTGIVITQNCALTFYCWSALVLSGIIVTLFLPAEKKMDDEHRSEKSSVKSND